MIHCVVASPSGLFPALALADPNDGDHHRGWHHTGWSGGWMVWPLVVLAVFGIALALVVGAVMLVIRRLGPGPSASDADQAMQILRERFARGEIDREEFDARRSSLDG